MKALLGIDVWRLYAAQGRYLPAAWVARTVGVSPTTMAKYLATHCPEYAPRKGWTPSRGWNWRKRMEDFWSNGERFEASGIPTDSEIEELLAEVGEDETGLDFAGAMEIVKDGLAVSRLVNCKRVVFARDGQVCVGRASDNSTCISEGPFSPTVEEIAAKDWMIDAHKG